MPGKYDLPWQHHFGKDGERRLKTMIRKCFCALLLFAACLSFPQNTARAEDTGLSPDEFPPLIDCSEDQSAYGKTVALLNRLAGTDYPEPDTEIGRRSEEMRLYPVLCRTDGSAVDFSVWDPRHVICGPDHCYTLYFGGEALASIAAEALSALPGIEYAERDGIVEACATETAAFRSWGAEAMEYGEYLNYCGGIARGRAVVAVVDSGMYPHPELADRIRESGFDYIDGDEDATNDPFGHGTNVGGVIADCTRGFPVYLYPIRMLDSSGYGSTSNAVNAIREATGKGVDIINLSFVSKNDSQALNAAVLDALGAGITVVVAAGNAASDASVFSPAGLADAGVIVVGSAEADGSRSDFSNYGSSVDLYAYGSNIRCCANDGGYAEATGTSVAAPHVSALAALLTMTHAGITPAELETRVCLSTERAGEVNVPNLLCIIPAEPGFSLRLLTMDMEDSIPLPAAARPRTAMEKISYRSSDDTVVTVSDGVLTPVGPGRAKITARCPGLADALFTVEVTAGECRRLTLPESLKSIEAEAFSGDTALTHVIVPDGCESIAEGAFDQCPALKTVELSSTLRSLPASFSDAVVLCPEVDALEEYLKQHQISYILQP